MSRYVFDIETDGLLDMCETVWIIVTHDIDTEEVCTYLPHLGDMRWVEKFDTAELLIGHNILGFDLPALMKVYGYSLPREVSVHDTLIMSQVLNYNRFGRKGHSLEAWGEHFGQPKQAHEDWSQYSEEMRTRCTSDVALNVRVYDTVLDEFLKLLKRGDNIKHYLRAEHAVAKWCGEAELYGWPFDVKNGQLLFERMTAELDACRATISPLLGMKTVPVDRVSGGKYDDVGRYKGEVTPRRPKWTLKGCYDAHTANWFNVNPWSGYEGEERPIDGEYCRVEFKPLDLDSIADVKVFLFRHGWEPTEWNYKKTLNEENGRYEFTRTSPKVTEDSLEVMQGHGKLYCDFLTTKSRHAILKSWLENVDANGNLHGEAFPIGTPSMRTRHSVIVNVPSTDSAWGKEMRALFTCPEGWVLIGCDSSGNQARGLAHYLNNAEFIDVLLNKDIHTYNAVIIDQVLASMNIDWSDYLVKVKGVKASEFNPLKPDEKPMTLEETLAKRKRGVAKRILYAFLFGASGGKLWSYIFETQDKTRGNRFKAGFTNAVPGFKALIDKLEKIYKQTSAHGDGYIPSIAGNRVYVDSKHKLLVYLLQSCEKATCGMALAMTVEKLRDLNIPYRPCIFMHDEIDFAVPKLYGEQAREIGATAFAEGPKLYGINIMAGEGKLGRDWFDVH